MNDFLEDWREAPTRTLLGPAKLILRTLALAIFSVMALLERFVMYGLALIVLGLLALGAVYLLINQAHPTHFPFGVVVSAIFGIGMVALVYQMLLHWLPRLGTRG